MKILFSLVAVFTFLLLACDGDEQGLATGSEFIVRGERDGSRLGSSLEILGDIDGDGRDDFALGLPGDRRNGEKAGAVYIYYGSGNGFSQKPDAILLGESGDEFGTSIAGLGDLNDDGLEEFAVSSKGSLGEGLSGSAAIYLFSGRGNILRNAEEREDGVRASSTAESKIVDLGGEAESLVVSSAGDLNHDGGLDLAIGSPSEDRAYVFLSTENFFELPRTQLSQASIRINGEDGSKFGHSVEAVADVNQFNEGLDTRFGDDLLIGAPSEGSAGAAYLLLGSAGISRGSTSSANISTRFEGRENESEFGFSVSGLGDFDGDAILDIAISAPGDSRGGSVWIFFGEPISGPRDLGPARFTAEFLGDRFGEGLASMYPLGWNGLYPVVVGAPGNRLAGVGAGSVYVLSNEIFTGDATPGGASASAAVADLRFLNPLAGSGQEESFGSSLSGGLDVNEDGQADLLIGAPGNDRGGENAGAATLEY